MSTSLPQILRLVQAFVLQPVTPDSTFEFETSLREELRETGRLVMEVVLNQIEPDTARMPKQIESGQYVYSRKNEKTRVRNGIGTTFGTIELSRCSYEPLREGREDRQKSISPLELSLGIVAHNATPALAGRVGHAASDQTQSELREMLRRDCGISWSIGPMPRLVYVTDAGHHPTEYFNNVLAQMENPRQPGQKLEWARVVDFYHACEYIAKLSPVLFEDDERAALGWQHRMRHKLKHDPNVIRPTRYCTPLVIAHSRDRASRCWDKNDVVEFSLSEQLPPSDRST